MLAPLVVFWLATPAHPEPAAEITSQWAAQRGYRPVPPAAPLSPAYAEEIAQQVEALLEDARTPSPASQSNFERLDRLLAEHPELPQAGWWLAERYALEGQHAAQSPPASEAATSVPLERTRWARGLEGPRAAPAGAGPASAEGQAPATAALELLDLRPRDELWLDGKRAAAGLPVTPGRHLAQLFRSGRRVWASWVDLGTPPQLRIADPTPACSEQDLWGTEHGARGPVPAPGVRCETWAVASASPSGVDLALCRRATCGTWEHVEQSPRRTGVAAAGAAEPAARLPAWVTWGLVGVGAAAGTALVLWQAGAFDRPAPATQFVFTGPTAAALVF